MAELLENIGHNIRRLREEKGWNQTELGFHADTSPSIISLIENGKRNPSTATLAKIAGALGVEVVDLFPKAGRSSLEPTLWNGGELHPVDVSALDANLAADLRQQREFRLEELGLKLERAGDDQERREEAYRNLKNWWVWFTQPVMTLHKAIPQIPGPALMREGEITVERVREFAPGRYTKEEFRTFEEALKNDEARAVSER